MSRYVTVYPENLKSEYTEYDSIDFVMTFENRALVPNSVRLKADLEVYNSDGNTRLTDAHIFIDGKVGATAFVSSIQTDFQNMGSVENFQEVARYCRMVHDATLRADDLNNSEAVCELKVPKDDLTNFGLRGIAETLDGNGANAVDFSIKPKFCLNNMSGPLNYTKSGTIRVNVKLARNASALYLGNNNTETGPI